MIAPLIGLVGYLAFPPSLRLDATLLHQLTVIHNLILVLFSAWLCGSLATLLWPHGLVVASGYYFQLPEFQHLIYLFYVSKYYEFFDTFLLYLGGKQPIFLQKFHHVGAVLSWHLCYVFQVDGIWFPTLWNAFIHTIMYSYYLACVLKWSGVAPLSPWRNRIKRVITRLQLTQFFAQFLVVYAYVPPVETWFNYSIILFMTTYGVGLIYLFGRFYQKTYNK